MENITEKNRIYSYQNYLIRRKVFKLLGGAFHIYDPEGRLAFYSKMKAFKLKEDIRLYSDESMQEETSCNKGKTR